MVKEKQVGGKEGGEGAFTNEDEEQVADADEGGKPDYERGRCYSKTFIYFGHTSIHE